MPYGPARPSLGSIKSCTLTASGDPLGRPSRPLFLKFPTSSFFFGINRDDRLIRRHKRSGLIADVLKLCVPVHVTASFPCLTVCLQTVPQFAQTIGYHVRTSRMLQTLQSL